MVALVLLTGFALDNYVLKSSVITINFSIVLAGLAGASVVSSLVGLFYQPKKFKNIPSLFSFLLISSAISLFIFDTGNIDSPYVILWSIVALFVSVFGVWTSLLAVATMGVFVAAQYILDKLTVDAVILDIIAGIVPFTIGLFLWRLIPERSADDKMYKNLASELSQVANQAEVIINAIGDGVIALDKKGSVALINPAAQIITGWSKQDALGLSHNSILQFLDIQGNTVDSARNPVQQVLNNNQQVRDNNLTLVTHNSKKVMVSILVSPLGDAGDGVIAVFRDITKEKTEEREQAEFISTASHEMRTPVASIEGYLGLALNPQTAQIDDKARSFITKAHESAQHLGRLFQDLLDVTKADDGRIGNQPKVVDIMQFVRDIVGGLQPKATEKGLNLIFKPQPDETTRYVAPVYYVNLDNDHLREIIGNLVENGIKYTEQGQVVVDVTGTDETVVLSVKDTGIGIPSEDMPHLFQKFYRVNNPETNQIGGTGLGLYLSRRLVETIGGRIWGESQYHKGSTFFVELPRIDNDEAKSLMLEQSRTISAPKQTPQTLLQDVVLPPRPTTSAPLSPQSMSQPVKPATEVPRGERLTPAQIAEQVAKLSALAKEQSNTSPATPQQPQQTRPLVGQPVINSRPMTVRVPERR